MKKVKLLLIGAGQRGAQAYAPYVLDNANDVEIVGVAEPIEERRRLAASTYSIPAENVYATWQEILERDRFADGVIIATQDNMHFEPAIKALEKGYHVLCEKPMSKSVQECIQMGQAAKKYGKTLSICHVLRYAPVFAEIKKVIDSGEIGQVMAVQLIENVAYWHQAHSYVRGNWRNSESSAPMILAKSCHDIDILLWLIGSRCTQVSSYGHLTHFKPENAPAGAAERCLDGCECKDSCPYYAPRIYIDWRGNWQADVIRSVVSQDTSNEALLAALRTGPYGRCVYHCDNNVVDHQVVNLDFENGATASFTMCGFTYEEGRKIKVMGTKGEIVANSDTNEIKYYTYLEKNEHTLIVKPSGGHMGGDTLIMRDFVNLVAHDGAAQGRTSAEQSVESHVVCLAAEQSRLDGCNVNMQEFLQKNTI